MEEHIVIKKVIANRKPEICLICPLSVSRTIDPSSCGVYAETTENGWRTGGKVPDERCLFEVEEE